VGGWNAAGWAKVNGWTNFSSCECLKEFTAECIEVYTLPGEAVKADGIFSSVLPWRVLDVWEKIWLLTERAVLPFRQSSFWPQWSQDLIHSPKSVLRENTRKALPWAFVGAVKLCPFLSNWCSGRILKDKLEDRTSWKKTRDFPWVFVVFFLILNSVYVANICIYSFLMNTEYTAERRVKDVECEAC